MARSNSKQPKRDQPRKRRNKVSPALESLTPSKPSSREQKLLPLGPWDQWPTTYWLAIAAMLVVFLYSYWPTLSWMAELWYIEPDYTHGWFVPALALSICWSRASSFPGIEPKISWAGASLFGVVILMRFAGRMAYYDFLDAWSILPLVAGAVWMLLGRRALIWALPAIGFLFFAIPLPFQAETMLSWQLRGFATQLSKFGLCALGYPAVSEGHLIWIGDKPLIVEQACSGLRIFVGMGAFAVYWAAVNERSWSDRIFLFVVAIPLAILVNAIRIIVIGMFTPYVTNTYWVHELSGIGMLFASFALLGAASWYWKILYRPEVRVTAKESLRSSRSLSAHSGVKETRHPNQAS
ncbi:MAG: exosortase/archaeosortase family protein [Planctomycetota bacterium]